MVFIPDCFLPVQVSGYINYGAITCNAQITIAGQAGSQPWPAVNSGHCEQWPVLLGFGTCGCNYYILDIDTLSHTVSCLLFLVAAQKLTGMTVMYCPPLDSFRRQGFSHNKRAKLLMMAYALGAGLWVQLVSETKVLSCAEGPLSQCSHFRHDIPTVWSNCTLVIDLLMLLLLLLFSTLFSCTALFFWGCKVYRRHACSSSPLSSMCICWGGGGLFKKKKEKQTN